jgi:hypothetical protein
MAEITRFMGMSIGFCTDTESHAHVHVSYNQHSCSISTDNYAIISGMLPTRVLLPAIEWVIENNDAIKANWELHKTGAKVPAMTPLVM